MKKSITAAPRRIFKFLSLLSVVLLLGIACSPSSRQPSQPAASATNVEQTFTLAIGEDVAGLNPQGYDAHSFVALAMMFEPLVRYGADGTIQPALAESWQASPDNLAWTFKLRQGVTFQDGTPFNAEAAKWNFQRWVNVADHDWLPLSTKIAAIDTPDPNTLVLRMKEPYYATLQELSLVRPVRFLSPKSVGADGKFSKPVGTGAWKLAESVKDQRLVFTPNESYWGEKPTLSKVVFDVIPDPQTRVAALLSKEVNLIGGEYLGGIPVESLPTLQNNPNVEVLTAEGTTTYLLRLNYRRAPFDQLQVRQALNYAIDRPAISKQVFNNLATPAQGFFAPAIPYISYPQPDLYTHKPDQSKALLDAAGWKVQSDGIRTKNGKVLRLTMLVNNDLFPQSKPMSEVIQAELKDLGVDVQLRSVNEGAINDAIKQGNFDMTLGLSYGSPYDPHSSLKDFFVTTGDASSLYYSDPQLAQAITKVLKTTQEADRQAQYKAIWQKMDEKAVAVPVLFSKRVYAIDKAVQNFKLAGTEYELNLQGVSIAGQ